jgi:hypothetical protein
VTDILKKKKILDFHKLTQLKYNHIKYNMNPHCQSIRFKRYSKVELLFVVLAEIE